MDLISLYLEYVKPLKGSERYNRWSILTVISALLERRVWIERGRLGVLFPNLYTILVGPPASGKSTSAELATRFIYEVKPNGRKMPRIGPTKITQAALYKELKEAERVIEAPTRGTIKMSPVFLYASELAINMADFGGGTLTNELIDFYDSKSITAITQKRTISDETLTLFNPSVTLLGCTTEGFLLSAAKDKLITSGLSSRIIFVVEPKRVEKQRRDIEYDVTAFRAITQGLTNVYGLRGPMTFTPDARELLITLSEKADNECYNTRTEMLQNYFGRKPDHITKLAMCFTAARNKMIIEPKDIELATQWIEGIEGDMIDAFGKHLIDDDTDLMKKLLNIIPLTPEHVSESTLMNRLYAEGFILTLSPQVLTTFTSLEASDMIKVYHVGNRKVYTRLKEIPSDPKSTS